MITSFCSLLAALLLQSQAMLVLSGVSSAEELDEQTVERLENLKRHPLSLNQASRGRLNASGLFTPYQIASILDYRGRSGDILSFTELGFIDGIGVEMAGALQEFISLESKNAPGQKQKQRISTSLTGRYGSNGYLAKGRLNIGERVELAIGSKSGAVISGGAAYYGRRWLGKVIAGQWNARFGQGLVLWTGMTMSGFSPGGNLDKRAAGLSLSGSTSPLNVPYGLAAEFNFGRWSATTILKTEFGKSAFKLTPAVNLNWTGRNAGAGITVVGNAERIIAGADARWHTGFTSLWAEFAWDFAGRAPAAVLGMRWEPAYLVNFSALARWYSPGFSGQWSAGARSSSKTSDEAGGTLGFRFKWLSATADYAWHPSKNTIQAKAIAVATPVLKRGIIEWEPTIRLSARWRSSDSFKWRSEVRLQSNLGLGEWKINLRGDAVWCREYG